VPRPDSDGQSQTTGVRSAYAVICVHPRASAVKCLSAFIL